MLVIVPLFPGTDWLNPEFKNAFPKPLGLNIQQLVTYLLCTLLVLAVSTAYFSRLSLIPQAPVAALQA